MSATFQVVPWYFSGGDPNDLSVKIDSLARFADEVITKLKRYEELGSDFMYTASYGAPIEAQKRSFELFIKHVVPEFK